MMMRFNFKFILKKSILVVIVSGIVSLIYLGYFFAVGIPKTQARNYYNFALKEESEGKVEAALGYLYMAEQYWPEGYIVEKFEELNTQK